jgi:hypothetical protein
MREVSLAQMRSLITLARQVLGGAAATARWSLTPNTTVEDSGSPHLLKQTSRCDGGLTVGAARVGWSSLSSSPAGCCGQSAPLPPAWWHSGKSKSTPLLIIKALRIIKRYLIWGLSNPFAIITCEFTDQIQAACPMFTDLVRAACPMFTDLVQAACPMFTDLVQAACPILLPSFLGCYRGCIDMPWWHLRPSFSSWGQG